MKPQKKYVSDIAETIPFSGIRKFFDVAQSMKGVISLGVGEPDFKTPWNVREEAIYHLEKRRTVYTSNAGQPELLDEISKYLLNLTGINYSPKNQIIATAGASEGIDIALRAIINPGDEILIAEPCYVSYKPCVMLAGGVPVTLTTRMEDEFRLTADDFNNAITEKTKALIISYPNNPTGAVMRREDLEGIAKIAVERDILVITDEIYAELTYGADKHASIASLPGMAERTIVLNGFSKAFAMTGWRLGYVAGPPEIIRAMLKIHQYIIMCAPTTAQFAGIEALKNSMQSVELMRRDFDARRRLMVKSFREMGLDVFEPMGAFYLFPSIKSTGLTSEQFCNKLLHEAKVAVVPGSAFGESGEGHIRCSYAYSIESLKQAVDRISGFIESL